MAGRIEKVFFFIHRQFEKLNALFKSKMVSLIAAPLLPFLVAILCVVQISNNSFIIFNSIIFCLAIIFTFLLTVSSLYFLKGDNIFNRYNREKSNNNLTQFQISEISGDIANEKLILDILESNKDRIIYYYFELRRIELFDFDTTIDDFKNLISNCFKKTNDNYVFKLEVSAYEAHYFIRGFLVPFLEELNEDVVVSKKGIASLIKYKNNQMYHPININSFSTKTRVSYTEDQKKLYDSVKIR
ncbi:hypothetical protein [Flavobacterium daejeonense]|uniref:hypothetical protein n=1 Tax=Flavobacterium daejeonense TaxID=350893 RepID=UPI00047A03D7|nr:hypothetical protein [Flavobacterium daejeonense]